MFFTPWHMLLEACADADEVVLSAPYMKVTALAQIIKGITGGLRVVSRWAPQDIASGVSDIECRNLVTDRGGRFFLSPNLHAKYYRFSNAIFIGSANLTPTGMGFGYNSNLEILCSPPDTFHALEFEAVLFRYAHEVTDWEYQQWATLEATPITNVPSPFIPQTLDLSQWFPRTRVPEYVWLMYTGNPE